MFRQWLTRLEFWGVLRDVANEVKTFMARKTSAPLRDFLNPSNIRSIFHHVTFPQSPSNIEDVKNSLNLQRMGGMTKTI